ncbi:hypothetical protein L211DRAFT_871302 [Terfezia boudieri ATCC MYA-4762]|uniref:Vacuolar ATPase assembly protein VMA22 n=1 Tax=Terfezia boudieri ATCC MYA-4762 TaxID=1051890 RepID=A0A3N4LD74_9PEZI|nr:hypothetical protein L211DRAFT_871302 [Terfezia boudieri ATCC MYA-4762]
MEPNISETSPGDAGSPPQDRLEALILSYLDLIDTYTELQKDICRNFSEGYLSIAQANFSSNTGRRYGQDFYDERMKAMKGVEISYEDTRKSPTFKPRHFPLEGEPIEVSEKDDAGKTSGVRRRKGGKEETFKETFSEGKPQIKTPNTDTQLDDEEGETSASPPIKKDPRDPLKWFGIFVPPALKIAQLRFSDGSNIDAA